MVCFHSNPFRSNAGRIAEHGHYELDPFYDWLKMPDFSPGWFEARLRVVGIGASLRNRGG